MNAEGWLFLVVFLGAVGLLISFTKSSAASVMPTSSEPSETPEKSKMPEKSKTPESSKKGSDDKDTSYIAIYEYVYGGSIKKCAHCDGENKYGVKKCCICGNNIDS